ncbi:MAG: SRPBCC family protein [Kibdelosporangium sp.]
MARTEVVFEPGRQDIIIRREFDAPRDVVFQAFTDPRLIPRWWGARRFATTVDTMDVRRGGEWRFITRNNENGTEYGFRGVYHDVRPGESIVSTFEFEYGGPGYLQFNTESFEETDGRTLYTSVALFQSIEDRDGWIPTDMDKGVRESMDLMDELIAGRLQVHATRTFDAPVSRIWRAWTESEQMKQWWGPEGFTAPVAEMNVADGETSLICMRSPDGHDLYNTWTYERVVPERRLEFLMGFADENGHARTPADLGLPADIPSKVRHVVTFEQTGGKTELTVTEFGYTSPQTVELAKLGLEQCLDKLVASLS